MTPPTTRPTARPVTRPVTRLGKQRSDAVENRAGLIEAARRVFSIHGVAAPLDLVIREAEVGRGTLYRHFPDREALVAAILDDRMADLEDAVAAMPDDNRVERLLVHYRGYLLDTPGLVAMMRTSPGGAVHFQRLQTRLSLLLERVINAAIQLGETREDLSAEDVILVLAMMEGAVANTGPDPSTDTVRRTIALLVRCLRTPNGLDRPLPQLA